eukprot:COSAG05_NODE_58_length_23277_cov_16.934162_5_plen_1082_part_00
MADKLSKTALHRAAAACEHSRATKRERQEESFSLLLLKRCDGDLDSERSRLNLRVAAKSGCALEVCPQARDTIPFPSAPAVVLLDRQTVAPGCKYLSTKGQAQLNLSSDGRAVWLSVGTGNLARALKVARAGGEQVLLQSTDAALRLSPGDVIFMLCKLPPQLPATLDSPWLYPFALYRDRASGPNQRAVANVAEAVPPVVSGATGQRQAAAEVAVSAAPAKRLKPGRPALAFTASAITQSQLGGVQGDLGENVCAIRVVSAEAVGGFVNTNVSVHIPADSAVESLWVASLPYHAGTKHAVLNDRTDAVNYWDTYSAPWKPVAVREGKLLMDLSFREATDQPRIYVASAKGICFPPQPSDNQRALVVFSQVVRCLPSGPAVIDGNAEGFARRPDASSRPGSKRRGRSAPAVQWDKCLLTGQPTVSEIDTSSGVAPALSAQEQIAKTAKIEVATEVGTALGEPATDAATVAAGSVPETLMAAKLRSCELAVYGHERKFSLLRRVEQIEMDLKIQSSSSLSERIAAIENKLFPHAVLPSPSAGAGSGKTSYPVSPATDPVGAALPRRIRPQAPRQSRNGEGPEKRSKPQLSVVVRGLVCSRSGADTPVEDSESESDYDANDAEYCDEDDADIDDNDHEFLDDAEPEKDERRLAELLVYKKEEDLRCSARCDSYMQHAASTVSSMHGDTCLDGPLPWRGFATNLQMRRFLGEVLGDDESDATSTVADDSDAAELFLRLFGCTQFTDHRGTEPMVYGNRIAIGWERGQQAPFTLQIVQGSFKSLLDGLLDYTFAMCTPYVRCCRNSFPAHKLQLDGFTRRVTQEDARNAIDMWWGSKTLFDFIGLRCPCPSTVLCRCQINSSFDPETQLLTLNHHRRSNNCYRRLAWAKLCHKRLAADSAGSCVTMDLVEQVAEALSTSRGRESESMNSSSWLPDSIEQLQSQSPQLPPPHSSAIHHQRRQEWQELLVAARAGSNDWSRQDDRLVFNQASFAVLVYSLCRRDPLRYRYRLQPEALFMLQCAVEAAISLKLKIIWPWPKERLVQQNWESIDLVSLRKLATECPGLLGDSDPETWTHSELVAKLRAF